MGNGLKLLLKAHHQRLKIIPRSVYVEFLFQTDISTVPDDHMVENIDVDETISEEEMVSSVLQELCGYVYEGITTYELCRVLKEYFGVVAAHCCDLIQRMKIELDMYCPDKQHLYFIRA